MWISIKDKPFPVGTPILVMNKAGVATTAFYDPEPICDRSNWISWYGSYDMPGFEITHWMHIPKLEEFPEGASELAKRMTRAFREATKDAVEETLNRGNYVVGTNENGQWVKTKKDENGNLIEQCSGYGPMDLECSLSPEHEGQCFDEEVSIWFNRYKE